MQTTPHGDVILPAPAARRPLALPSWLLLAGPGVIWGASFLFIAEGLSAIGPFGVTFVRIAVGFATLALFPASRARVGRADWRGIATLGVVWLAFPLTLFPLAEQRVSSALTGMLNRAVPLATALVGALISRRAPARGVAAGLAVGLAGTTLVALPCLRGASSSALGVGLVLLAIASYGCALHVLHPLQARHGALPVIWRAQGVALALTAPLGVCDLLGARWSPGPLLALLALGALGTGVAYVLLSLSAARIGATRASATTYLIPVVALVLGVVARGERVAALSVLGSAVCLAGAWLLRRARGDAR
jgi:drug/metabolite transporter (DMT)-like permease